MAKTQEASPERQEIIDAQNALVARLPADRNKRLEPVREMHATREKMNDKIAQVKKDSGLADVERKLTEQHGATPQALQIVRILKGMPAGARASTLHFVMIHAEDERYVEPDLFRASVTDINGNVKEPEKPAEQRTPEEMAASHESKDPLEVKLTSEEAQKALEDYLKAHPRKRGQKPAELIRLEKQVEEALAAEGKPPSNVVPIGQQMREGSAAGDAHIKAQSEQMQTDAAKAAAKGQEPAPAAEAPKKRGSRKKADESPAPTQKSGPPAADEDDEAEEAPAAPAPPSGAMGSVPPSFRVG